MWGSCGPEGQDWNNTTYASSALRQSGRYSILLHHGASMQSKTMHDHTVIRYACRNSLDSLRLLLQAGGRVDEVDNFFGHTAVHEMSASVLWHPKILITILDIPYAKDIINLRDERGQTALDCTNVIDPYLLASRSCDTSYESQGEIGAFDGSGVAPKFTATGAGDFFSVHGPAALFILFQGWHELGIYVPNKCTYESVVQWLVIIKEEIIRRLIKKGAKTAQ